MQEQLFCATCTMPLEFKVPELTDNRWHVHCESCGNSTLLEANLNGSEELATFSSAGVHSAPMKG